MSYSHMVYLGCCLHTKNEEANDVIQEKLNDKEVDLVMDSFLKLSGKYHKQIAGTVFVPMNSDLGIRIEPRHEDDYAIELNIDQIQEKAKFIRSNHWLNSSIGLLMKKCFPDIEIKYGIINYAI